MMIKTDIQTAEIIDGHTLCQHRVKRERRFVRDTDGMGYKVLCRLTKLPDRIFERRGWGPIKWWERVT